MNTTVETARSPAAFINALESEQRRKDCRELMALMKKATGHPPKMWGASIVGFDRYHYEYASGRTGESLITGFSPRKADLVLYSGPGLETKRLTSKLGKHRTGKGCLYLKKLDDVDRDVLRELVEVSVSEMRKRYPE
jgi:hypothetical protein